MNDQAQGAERVILVHINFPSGSMEEDLEEFKELALSAGAKITQVITGARSAPDSKYFAGSGKAEEIAAAVAANKAELVIFNHVLSPGQERNLEILCKCRVLDRTGLILDIFAQRARSFEGKLQVELALLTHLSTRLIRGWTHLERQRGGIGLRGPGETQLEVDRRLIRNKIKVIQGRLLKIRKQRDQSRRARRKATVPTVALVGYTNAGKSTLFNLLTGAEVYAANQLFATLDPTLRRIELNDASGPVILADTVGFIRHLPHDLVAAFQATLEEVSEADLLLHVVDAHDNNRLANIEQVNTVLASINAKKVPTILVYNKIDLATAFTPHSERDELGAIYKVFISAATKQGIPELIAAITERLGNEMVEKVITLPPSEAKFRANLFAKRAVIDEKIDEDGNHHLLIRLPRVEMEQLFR